MEIVVYPFNVGDYCHMVIFICSYMYFLFLVLRAGIWL